MVKQINLYDLSTQKMALLNTIAKKIALNKHTTLNQEFDTNLKVDHPTISSLVETIEMRIRKAEIIYYTYLENADHPTLCGQNSNLPIKIDLIFSYGTAILSESVEINDKQLYKEIIDLNFQHFILLIASLYENSVRLTEILVKKVIVHKPGDKPISTPLHNYISFFESLIKLGYRQQDHLSNCFSTHDTFLKKILEPVNKFRNAYIHGFQSHLTSDGFNYKINPHFANTFSPGSPDLNIDRFSEFIISNSIPFFSDLFTSLTNHIRHHSKKIPA